MLHTRRLLLLVLLLVVMMLNNAPPHARARTVEPGASCRGYAPWSEHPAELSPAQVEAQRAINWAAAYWGVSAQWLTAVAWCESSLLPWAYNPDSGTVGLFQFVPSTYWAWAAVIGEQRSYWNAWASANVAAWAFAHGHSGAWACAHT